MKKFKSTEKIELKPKPTNWNFKDLEGCRFGQLYVAGHIGKRYLNANTYWLVHCDCGSFGRASTQQLTSGSVTNCGCLRRLQKQKTQNTATKTIETWSLRGAKSSGIESGKLPVAFTRGTRFLARFDAADRSLHGTLFALKSSEMALCTQPVHYFQYRFLPVLLAEK